MAEQAPGGSKKQAQDMGVELGVTIGKAIVDSINKTLVNLDKQLSNIGKNFASTNQGINQLATSGLKLNGVLAGTTNHVDQFNKRLEQSNVSMNDLADSTSNATTYAEAYKNSLSEIKEEIAAQVNMQQTGLKGVFAQRAQNLAQQVQEGTLTREGYDRLLKVIKIDQLRGDLLEKQSESLKEAAAGESRVKSNIEQSLTAKNAYSIAASTGLKGEFTLIAANLQQSGLLTKEKIRQLQLDQQRLDEYQKEAAIQQSIVDGRQSIEDSTKQLQLDVKANNIEVQTGLRGQYTQQAALLAQKGELTTSAIKQLLAEQQLSDELEEQKKQSGFVALAQNDFNQAMKQAQADIKLKNLMIKTGLTGEAAELARIYEQQKETGVITEEAYNTQLAKIKAQQHEYEQLVKSRDIVESLANWQLELKEELESYEMGWEKVKSKVKAIITDPKLAKTVFAAEGIKTAIESVKKFGEGFEKMKEKGLSAGQAATAQMKTISTMSVLGLSDTQGVMEQVIESYGNVNALSRTQVDNIGQMAHHMGITGQEAMQVNATLSQMTGETTESAIEAMHFTENLAKASGVAPGKVMKDIAKNSAAVALYSKDGAKGFGKAAIELHKMGVEIGTAAKMADGLLDFENSINKQMEASVLLGREINLDKAREMALNGDLAGAAKETLANIGGAAEFTKMNVIQKRALAEAAGMTVEELQKALDAEEEQQKYHGEEAGFWMNTIGYVTEYGTKLGGFLKEHGMLLLSGLNTLAQQETRQFLINGLQKGYNALKAVGNGILLLGKSIFDQEARDKVILWTKEKAQWVAQKAHIAWLKLNAFFGSDKAKGKLAEMAKDKLAGGVTDKAKDMATDKAKDLAGDKTKDLVGKASEGANKASEKAPAPKAGEGIKTFLQNLAIGLKSFANAKVLMGAVSMSASLVLFGVGIAAFAKALSYIPIQDLLVAAVALPAFAGGIYLMSKVASKVNIGDVMKASVAMLILGAALPLAAYAFSLVGGVDPVAMMVFAGGLTVLALATAVLGSIAGNVIVGALAMGILSAALIPAAFAFSLLEGVSVEKIIAFSVALPLLGLAAAGLGLISPFIAAGAIALGILGGGLAAVAVGLLVLQAAAGGIKLLQDLINAFSGSEALLTAAVGLAGIAGGLGLLGAAGLVAFPGLVLAGIGLMAMVPGLMALNAVAQSDVVTALAQSLIALGSVGGGLATIGLSLLGLAGGLVAVAGASLLALPAIGMLAGVFALATVPMLMFGAAAATAGAGITIAAYGLSLLAESFGKLATDQIIGVASSISIMSLSLWSMVPVLPLAAAGLVALGAASLLAFPGLMLASVGLSLMQLPLLAISAVVQSNIISLFAESLLTLGTVGPGLLITSAGLIALGAAGLFAFPGLTLAGAGLMTMVPGLFLVNQVAQAGALITLSQTLTALSAASTGLAVVGASLFGIAGGLGAIALAGFAAMPIIGALAGLAAVAPMLAGLGSLFGGGGAEGQQQPTAQTNTTAAPAEDGKMDILISEIRSLRDIMSKGGVINMDGKKVGDVVRLAMNTSGVR